MKNRLTTLMWPRPRLLSSLAAGEDLANATASLLALLTSPVLSLAVNGHYCSPAVVSVE